MAASFTQQTDTDRPDSTFDDLYVEDLVLAACSVGHRQLSRLEISPYQQAVLARGLDHWHWHQVPDRGMEQSLGYAAAVGTIVMDELVSVCGRAEVRFTGVHTDLGIVENDTAILKDRVRLLMERLEGNDHEFRRMRSNRIVIQDRVERLEATVHKMRRDIGTLVHVNQMMHSSLVDLTLSRLHGWDNPIVIDNEVDSVMEAGPIPEVPVEGRLVLIEDVEEGELVSESSEESEGVWEIAREEFKQGVDTRASSPEL